MLPDRLDFDEGAALTVNYLTAYRVLAYAVKVRPGQKLLISGATGSAGHALVHVRASRAGASAVIDLSLQDAVIAVPDLTDRRGAGAPHLR